MANLAEIEALTKTYADARQELSFRVLAATETMRLIKAEALPGIKAAVAEAKKAEAKKAEHTLREAVRDSPGIFEKPKTRIMHGVKVGFQKAKGKLSWADPATVVRLIRGRLPGQADVLIQVRETPAKDALARLSAADLKRVGCTLSETGDEVVIRPVDGQVEKLVDALLKETNEEKTNG